ncbi:MAG TPA: class I SAM-dependent methyltransferase [Rubrobacteraceae bacterium]|nr:class I SAM-dependent methyltransferase [Rubrobacteraceae bacterium]
MSDELHAEHRECRGDVEAERFWEEHYSRRERVWSGRANPVLADVAGSLRPGAALDLGCGEGGDAIWLARQGWRVTAVDVSATALVRAAADAATAGVADRIDFQQHDLARTFPGGAFDLVSAQYLHSPIEFPRARVLRAAASAVTPGGLLLIVDHASVSPRSWAAPEETLALLDLSSDEWHTEKLEAREREATRPSGQRITVTDNIIAVRRLTP